MYIYICISRLILKTRIAYTDYIGQMCRHAQL